MPARHTRAPPRGPSTKEGRGGRAAASSEYLEHLDQVERISRRSASMKLINDPLFHFERATNRVYDRAHGNTELLVQHVSRSRLAKMRQPDHGAAQADVLPPEIASCRFNCHTPDLWRQYGKLVHTRLAIKGRGRWHRYDPRGNALIGKRSLRLEREFHFGTRRDQNNVRLSASGLGQHITTLPDLFPRLGGADRKRQIVARKQQRGRRIRGLECH